MPLTLRAKCVVAGDSTVGKSCICQMFHSDGSHFAKAYSMTSTMDLTMKTINIPETRDTVELYLCDSPGKEIFSDMNMKYWENPNLVMIVFDVASDTSFSSCGKWLERVRSLNPDLQIPGVLVGNKVDLDARRVISPKKASQWAESNGLKYFECSAKEYQNVDDPFYYLANSFYTMYKEKIETFKALS